MKNPQRLAALLWCGPTVTARIWQFSGMWLAAKTCGFLSGAPLPRQGGNEKEEMVASQESGVGVCCSLNFQPWMRNHATYLIPSMLFWFLKPEEHNKGEKRKSWSRKWKIKILHLSLCLTNLGPLLHINQSILSLCVPAWVRRILIKKQEANNWGTQIYFLKWSSRFNEAWQNALSQ